METKETLKDKLSGIETSLKFKVDHHDGVRFDMDSLPDTIEEFQTEFEKLMTIIVEKGAR